MYYTLDQLSRRQTFECLHDVFIFHFTKLLYYGAQSIRIYDLYSCQKYDDHWVNSEFQSWNNKRKLEYFRKNQKQYKFRNDPVPRTGRRSNYGYWRHPKTAQELRNIDCFTRAKRKNIPTSWDDLERGDWRDKNWKRYRKHQWKS